MPKSPAFRFYPSDFMGSPDVQAMELQEVGAFIMLLSTAWLAERHGFLPDDDERLRRWSRMSREQWAQSRDMLLSKFPVTETGWRCNRRMVEEAKKQEAFAESQRIKSSKRWGKVRDSQSDAETMPGDNKPDAGGIPSVSAFVSVSASVSKEQKQNPSRGKREGKPVDTRHEVFKGLIKAAWEEWSNPLEPAWDGAEGKQLGMLISANPKLSPDGMRRLLQYRGRSHGVNLAERPSKWLRSLTDYARGPLNQFKQPEGTGNGQMDRTARNIAAAREAIADLTGAGNRVSNLLGRGQAGERDGGDIPGLCEGVEPVTLDGFAEGDWELGNARAPRRGDGLSRIGDDSG